MGKIANLFLAIAVTGCVKENLVPTSCPLIPEALVTRADIPRLEGETWADIVILLERTRKNLFQCDAQLDYIFKWESENVRFNNNRKGITGRN